MASSDAICFFTRKGLNFGFCHQFVVDAYLPHDTYCHFPAFFLFLFAIFDGLSHLFGVRKYSYVHLTIVACDDGDSICGYEEW